MLPQRRVVGGAAPARRRVGGLGRDGQGQQLAPLAQRGPQPRDERRVGGTVLRPDALQVEVEAIVPLGDDVVHDLGERARRGLVVGQEAMVQPAGEGPQRGQDPDAARSREPLQRLVVAGGEPAAGVDRHPADRHDSLTIGMTQSAPAVWPGLSPPTIRTRQKVAPSTIMGDLGWSAASQGAARGY